MDLESIIAKVSPQRALKRARARAALGAVAHYDGASKSRRTTGWRRVGTDANGSVRGSIADLRNVARDLVRNNPYARRGRDAIVHNVVGRGVQPQFKAKTERQTARLNELALAHFGTTAIDAEGRHALPGLQALALSSTVEGGEVIIRRRWRKSKDGLAVPFQVQVLEGDYLDASKDGQLPNGNTVVQGVEFDKIGRRVAYWLFSEHPGATMSYRTLQSKRVKAEDVIHVYRMERPGQVRGVSWFAPVMLTLHDFDDYEDAQLLRQKIAACFSVFIRDLESDDGESAGSTTETLEPGIIERLGSNKTVEFASPPGVDGYGDYARSQLQKIAAGLGITYEALTGDLKGVSFSAGRMGWLEFQRNVAAWQTNIIINQLCHGLERWFLDAAMLVDAFTDAGAVWTPPRREMIDPTKEVPALRDAVRAGFVSPSGAVRQMGEDPATHFQEYAEDMARLDDLGIVLDSDARQVSRAGLTQARAPGSELPGTSGGDDNTTDTEGGSDA